MLCVGIPDAKGNAGTGRGYPPAAARRTCICIKILNLICKHVFVCAAVMHKDPYHTNVRPSLHAFPSTRCRVEWHPTRNLMCMKLIPRCLPSGWQATGGESFLASWVPEGTTTTTTDASFVMLDYYCAKSMTFAMVPCFPMMTSE